MNAELDLLSQTTLKGSVVLLAALLLGIALHKTAAARRYVIWMTAMLALAILPLAMSLLPAWRVLPKTASEELLWQELEPDEGVSDSKPVSLPVGARFSFPAQAIPFSPSAAAPGKPKMSWNMSWSQVGEALPENSAAD